MRLSHIGWNLAGMSAPLLVAAITVPELLKILGQEKFGLLALAWGLIGYAGALDLGLGRALTQMVSRLRGESKLDEIPDVLATTERITLIAGVCGGLLIGLFVLLGGCGLIRVSNTPQGEIVIASLLMAVALPVQAMSATYRGMNEAYMNFKGISLLRVFLGVVNFAGPYAIAQTSTHLALLVSSIVMSRIFAFVIFRKLAHSCVARATGQPLSGQYSPVVAKSLFSFGTWVTVSGVIGPILVQADRFVIAASISAAAVSVYVLPYEVVVQSLVVVGAMSTVMFPTLCRLMHEKPDEWRPYFHKWLLRVAVLMGFVCSALALLLPTILPLWIKNGLQPQSILIGKILCIGVFANSLGSMFYAALHAQGRADLTAKVHLIELPLFLILLMLLISKYGLSGAAFAWSVRMLFDAAILLYLVKKHFNFHIR